MSLLRRVLALATLLLSAATAQAQIAIYEDGYILREDGRVTGQLVLGSAAENGTGVTFRPYGGESARLGVGDISGYGVDGGARYLRDRFLLSPGADSATVFGRVVQEGPAVLFALATPDGTRFAIRTGDREPTTLVPTDDGSPVFLAGILTECDRETAPAEAYTEAALAASIDRYNRCVDRDYQYTSGDGVVRAEDLWRPSPSVDIGLGLMTGTFERNQDPFGRAVLDPVASGFELRASAGIDLIRRARWLEVMAEVGYTRDALTFGLNRTPPVVSAFDLYTLGLGARVTIPGGPTELRFAAGALIGANAFRTKETLDRIRDFDSRPGIVRDVSSQRLKGNGGSFIEVGVAGVSTPVVALVRYQWLGLADKPFLIDAAAAQYTLSSIGGSLRWRFGH